MADLVYKREEKPRSNRDWILYSFQWLVTMFYAVVWGYAIVGVGLEFEGAELNRYMSAIILTIGISTLVQALLGHRMAMVAGPNVIPSLAIVAAFTAGGIDYALHSFMAQAIAGIIIGVIALTGAIKFIRKIWSPIVLGAMIIMIGLAVAGLGLEYMVQETWDLSFAAAFLLALGGSYLAIKGKGVWGTLPPLLIIGLGYIIFIVMGRVDFSFIEQAPMLTTPELLPYGFEMPPWDLIIIMLVVNLMAALNLYGNIHGYAKVIDEEVSPKQEKKCFTFFGFVETTLPGLFGVPATVSYGENLGIVQLTRVAARSFIIVAAIIFIILAFFGPFIGLMAAIPRPIAGAVLLGIASTVIGIGADTFHTAPKFGRREQTLVGFSIFLSLGLYLLPDDLWDQTPRLINTLFSNPVISVILFVIIFEQVIFRKPKGQNEEAEEEEENGEKED